MSDYDVIGPYRGACAVCGGPDARHRMFDVIAEQPAGVPDEELADDYGLTVEAVRSIRGGVLAVDENETRYSYIAFDCFICFQAMSRDQDLVRDATGGVVAHRACMSEGDGRSAPVAAEETR